MIMEMYVFRFEGRAKRPTKHGGAPKEEWP